MAKKRKPGSLSVIPEPTPEALARVTQTVLWIVQGQAEGHITEAIRATWPDQDAKPLIAAAIEELQKSADFDPRVIRGWCFEAFRELYRRTVETGDFGSAIRCVKEIKNMAAEQAEAPSV